MVSSRLNFSWNSEAVTLDTQGSYIEDVNLLQPSPSKSLLGTVSGQ